MHRKEFSTNEIIVPARLFHTPTIEVKHIWQDYVTSELKRKFDLFLYYMRHGMNFHSCEKRDNGETRVASYELLVTSWKLKNMNWNSNVQVLIHVLQTKYYEFKSISLSSNPRVASSNPRVTSSNPRVTSSNPRVQIQDPKS